MPREKSAGAIIFREKQKTREFLLLHYPGMNSKGGHWEFTKGHVEEGESEEDTVKREVAEETGINDLKFIAGFKHYLKYFFRQYKEKNDKSKKRPWVFKLVVFFLAKTSAEDVLLSHEHDNFLWLPYQAALKKITYKNSKELFKKAHSYLIKKSRNKQ